MVPGKGGKLVTDNVRKTVYVMPHTHWDREWYEPFQVFRARLVRVLDHALGVLDRDPRFRRFVLDGQAVILEDYLEARPEREGDIRRHVQDGRLRIGPWYVLADEFLVSPEALIRNLAIGRRVSQRFGRPMPIGYTPDPFGHIAQLPLILAGFGLGAAVFQRGVGDEAERLGLEFIWEATDGSAVLAIQLPATYSAAAGLGHATWDYEAGGKYDADLATRHVRTILFGDVDPPEELPFWLKLPFSRLRGRGLVGHSRSQALLLPNGTDHLYLQEDLPNVLEELARAVPEVDWVLGDLEEYLARVQQTAGPLERYQGEFRGSRYHHILSGVLSSRAYIKQANDRAQQLLERYAEPLVALVRAAGGYDAAAILEQAWKLLIKNHFHDSICGCSVDPVHREMMTRFASVTQIGETEARLALARLVGGTPAGVVPEPALESAMAVFNPLPYARETVVYHTVHVPAGFGAGVAVLDADGRPLPVQREVETVFAPGRSDRMVDRVTVMCAVPMPGLGVASLRVVAAAEAHAAVPAATGDGAQTEAAAASGAEQPAAGSASAAASAAAGSDRDVRVDAQSLENEHLRLEVGPDGPVLIDRASGRRHALRLRFEDTADAGDSYDFSPLAGDVPIVADRPAGPPRVVRSGPVVGSLAVVYPLTVPARLSADRTRREGWVEMPVDVVFTLERGARALQVTVSLNNAAEDHRLRLVVSSGVQSDHVWAGDSFVWLRRPVRPPKGDGWYQKPQPTAPMRHVVAVSEGQVGFAVMARGLKEYEAIPTAAGVDLAVTLLRCVGWLSRDDLLSRPEGAGPSLPVPEAQCLGPHWFELALMPFSGPYWQSPLLEELDAFVTPPMAQTVVLRGAGDHGAAFAGAVATRATGAGFLEISSPLLLSALKPADGRDSVIVRVWNPAPEPVEGWIRIGQGRPTVYEVRLDETRLSEEPLALDADGRLRVSLAPGGVRSYELVDWRLVPLKGGGVSAAVL